jgi:integrase
MAVKTSAEWKLANSGKDNYLVFPNEAGGQMNHSSMVQIYFHKGLKDARIIRIRFHDLRHTYASLLFQQGENIKDIQSQLEHSSPTVTLNVSLNEKRKSGSSLRVRRHHFFKLW